MEDFSVLNMCYANSAFGHVELYDWMTTVEEMVNTTAQTLGDAMDGIAGALDYVAMHDESTDGDVAMCFAKDPITELGLPEGYDPGPPRMGPVTTSMGPPR